MQLLPRWFFIKLNAFNLVKKIIYFHQFGQCTRSKILKHIHMYIESDKTSLLRKIMCTFKLKLKWTIQR